MTPTPDEIPDLLAEVARLPYVYGTLTEELLTLLPDQPMSFAEALMGDSKPARRIRQLCAAYGPVSAGALQEAKQIKYTTSPKPSQP